ncbi:HEAT repeat domain-containing protein [Methylocapsa palsarum]|uniref:HEAT repeat-containing protein n=1 Tax=Methylocapsa palsarum TaxID=1612308 RepID=A0A1I4CW49_9HYPH|nr:HEAT repeat domain-containing protein [Methylocapsa palsarum]SFK84569.1 HEAT repeat-containing protein [Methylocapsa palsarum]
MPLIRSKCDNAAAGVLREEPASLASASPDERWAAARAACDPACISSLGDALALELDARVRQAIFTALARIATPESAGVILPYMRVDDASTRTGALDALRAMPEAARPHLPGLLVDPDADVRILACDLVRDAGGADGPRWLCAMIETEPQANVCAAAVEVLGEIADAAAGPCLSRCAERFPDDPFLRFAIKVVADRVRAETPAPRG